MTRFIEHWQACMRYPACTAIRPDDTKFRLARYVHGFLGKMLVEHKQIVRKDNLAPQTGVSQELLWRAPVDPLTGGRSIEIFPFVTDPGLKIIGVIRDRSIAKFACL